MTSGYTAELGEQDKHAKNDIPCTERGWVCVPLVVEVHIVFGGWGNEAQEASHQETSHQDKSFLA